jgi:TfoX/Sxy family transcriptional regulator of competence genes
MPLDETLSDRIRQLLDSKKIKYTEKKMFGGLCFLVDDKMLMGAREGRIMARIDPEDEAKALKKKGARPMDFTGRPMKGYLFIDEKGYDLDTDLDYWVSLCLKFNPKAKSSKKKG